jgi:hypothetical protein
MVSLRTYEYVRCILSTVLVFKHRKLGEKLKISNFYFNGIWSSRSTENLKMISTSYLFTQMQDTDKSVKTVAFYLNATIKCSYRRFSIL